MPARCLNRGILKFHACQSFEDRRLFFDCEERSSCQRVLARPA
jgi:hypothetical protein